MLLNIWNYISNRGVSSFDKREAILIKLYNQMSLLTILGICLVSIISILLDFPTEYTLITFILIFFYLTMIVLNHFEHIYTSRLMISVFSPVWICVVNLFIAGNFNQGLLIVTSSLITYVSFTQKPFYKFGIISFNVIAYLISIIYLQTYGPVWGVIDLPYDEFFVVILASAWLGMVIFAFLKDREELIEDLQCNNIRLNQTTEELERFTYIASHDLKSPLRTINSFIGLIERDIRRGNIDALPERMQFVKSGAQQMNTLVEDILEISTLKNPKKKKKTRVDLNKVLEKVQINLTEDINSKNAVVNSDVLPAFYCDEVEFLLLFQNIIQNGIKYNESKTPTIDISSQEFDNKLFISFKDNGIGIDTEYHEQIFQFFKRLHTTEKYQGTGLGLGLCKKIVNSYGGEIEVDSIANEGSIFKIKLELEAKSN